jgi:hypothetical protein
VVALGSTLFAGAPALANSSGPLTLLPNGGTAASATYTSLIGAGLTLTSALDADKQKQASTLTGADDDTGIVTVNVPAVDPLEYVYYLIENSGEADSEITAIGAVIDDGWYQYNPTTGAYTNSRTATEANVATFTVGASNAGNTLVTDEKKIAIRATLGSVAGDRDVAPLFIDAPTATSSVKVKVTSWTDTLRGSG